MLMAIIEHESSGQARAVNGNCKGLMQVNEPYHRDRMKRLGVSDLYDPYGNILVATDYLSDLVEEYEDVPLVLMKYNGSSDAFERWESGNFTSYAKSIMERSQELEKLHYKKREPDKKAWQQFNGNSTIRNNTRCYSNYNR